VKRPSAARIERLREAVQRAGADQRVDLGNLASELLAVTLGHAPRDDESLRVAAVADLGELENLRHRLLACVLDEGAGVHDQHVGGVRIVDDHVRLGDRAAEHDLAVDLILCAAERREVDAFRHASGQSRKFSNCSG